MQQDQQPSDEWQQPDPTGSAAPYESVREEPDAPSESDNNADDMSGAGEDGDGTSDDVADERAQEADGSVVQWQATEYVQQDRSARWFIVLAVICLGLISVALFLMHSISFAILVPVMAAALVVYVRRPPAVIDYVVSRKGIHINDHLHTYDEFRSFGVLSHDGVHSVVLVPRKRFQLSQTMYFPEEVGEALVDMLAARIPMNEVKQDAIDHLLARLRL
jgi:hypothetical protein